jgi:CubicO group peptidase (beta-lactamase class C family)
MADFWAWHNESLAGHTSLTTEWLGKGYRFITLSVYGGVDQLYAAVVQRDESPVDQRPFPSLSRSDLQQTIADQQTQGYYLAFVSASWVLTGPVFAAVFEPQYPPPMVALELTSGSATSGGGLPPPPNTSTIQGMNYQAAQAGFIMRCATSYGFFEPLFAAVWVPNKENTLWNNDGVSENGAQLDARLKAETEAWCRPAFITLSPTLHYLSLFTASEVGTSNVFAGLTTDEYQSAFDQQTSQGYLPICVQGSGLSRESANFVAIFAKTTVVVPSKFTATGPTANAIIDTQVSQTMNQYPQVRQAALAIVEGVKLVYARGYTFAEPDWPLAYPTTYFRLASVSKTVTALAVFKLIELGELSLTETLQGILNLTTPDGGAPADSRFSQITVKHLLEHSSGLPTDAFSNGPNVVAAWQSVVPGASLPATQLMTDSYIATLSLVSTPGSKQVYSNCGYYLLGRIVAKKWGKGSPIDAYLDFLWPLGVTRLRLATDLIGAQPEGEARYQACIDFTIPWLADLPIVTSQMTPDQPMVAAGYGDDHLSLTQGNAGLSAAVTDLARLPAILIDPADNPVLKRATIAKMLNDALATAVGPRAGYGFDVVSSVNGQLYGQKGGEIENAAAVLQFSGSTGFVALFGCTAANRSSEVYPNWPQVTGAAAKVSWGNVDLFPCFNMRSLAPPVASAAWRRPGTPDLTDVFLVDSRGAVTEFSGGSSGWSSQRITDLWFAPLGAVIASCPELGEDLFLVGGDGALYVLVSEGGGNWNLPLPISGTGFAPPGAGVAAIALASNPNQTDVLAVNLEGQLTVASVTGGGLWTEPQAISEEIFPPGAGVAACVRTGVPGETDAFVVSTLGQLWAFANTNGQWTGSTPVSATGFALRGAPVGACSQYGSAGQTDVFIVGSDGSLHMFFSRSGGGWQAPSVVSKGPFGSGASVTVSPRYGAADETDIFVAGPDGTLWNCSVISGSYGATVVGPGKGFAPPGATVAVVQQPGTQDQTSLFAVNSASELCLYQSTGAGPWSDPPAYLGTTL